MPTAITNNFDDDVGMGIHGIDPVSALKTFQVLLNSTSIDDDPLKSTHTPCTRICMTNAVTAPAPVAPIPGDTAKSSAAPADLITTNTLRRGNHIHALC